MSKKPEKLSDIITENGMQELLDGYSDFGTDSFVTDEEQARILSSAMRKAGFEMKETMVTKKTRRHGRRFAAIIAAAVLMIMGAIGAGAFFLNKQGIINGIAPHLWNLREATEEELELLDGMTSKKGKLIENTFEELEVSYDGVVCDGNRMLVIMTLKKKDGTPLKAPEGYKWRPAYLEEKTTLPFAGKADRDYYAQILKENDDGSLSLAYQSIIYDQNDLLYDKICVGINGLYCVPVDTAEESSEIIEYANIAMEAYINEKDLEATEADYYSALEKYSAEYYKGSAFCEADPDGVIVKPKEFTANYKGAEMNVTATPMSIDLECIDITLFSVEDVKYDNWVKIQEERFSSIEIFYKDHTSETADCIGWGTGGNAQRFAFSCDYSTGKPMVISNIDHIVFDGETISFDTE
ncbi:MAG: hypothetical protein IJ740_15110 [Ruminococcus sp.]|nr:hypothetical protein [Ruminococcus sp.]